MDPDPLFQDRIRGSRSVSDQNWTGSATLIFMILGVREKKPEISLTQGVRGKRLKEYSI